MIVRKLLMSGAALMALCGVAMAQASSPSPSYPGSATPGSTYPGSNFPSSAPGAADTTGAAGATDNAASGTSISAITNPQTALKSASVESSDGTKIGKVSKVRVDASGQAESLDVKVGSKTVSLPATQATFDQNKNIVVAQLTASDIKNLPAPSKASGSGSTNSPAAPSNQ